MRKLLVILCICCFPLYAKINRTSTTLAMDASTDNVYTLCLSCYISDGYEYPMYIVTSADNKAHIVYMGYFKEKVEAIRFYKLLAKDVSIMNMFNITQFPYNLVYNETNFYDTCLDQGYRIYVYNYKDCL